MMHGWGQVSRKEWAVPGVFFEEGERGGVVVWMGWRHSFFRLEAGMKTEGDIGDFEDGDVVGEVACRPMRKREAGMRELVLKLAIWPRAWTPASVRPEDSTVVCSPVIWRTARSILAWMEGPCSESASPGRRSRRRRS